VLTRRTQILLDEARYERLRERADRSGESVAALIRGAIDRLLDEDLDRRSRAAESLLAAELMPVADWPELERELETMHDRSLDARS
jgi:ribbon-helix-helix CopG family protein